VFRSFRAGTMIGDLVAEASERRAGQPLLECFVRDGELARREPLETLRARAVAGLGSLPAELRRAERPGQAPYPVTYSKRLLRLAPAHSGG
jgi:hypothetical protein